LHLKAGTTAAATGPLKFTSGSLMTTAEAGAIEFLSDDYYATITTGAARKGFVLNDGTNLTSGLVPYATTNGRLTNAANFTFNGTNLTVGTTAAANTTGYKILVDSGAEDGAGIGVRGYIKATNVITGSTTLDLAETYPVKNSCVDEENCPDVGDVVCLEVNDNSFYITKCLENYSEKIVGVVSANPGMILGGSEVFSDGTLTSEVRAIALSGRVPIKVSTMNGEIKAGDRLTSSEIPGVAVKATSAGRTIGLALYDLPSNNTEGTVTMMVNSDWSIGDLTSINFDQEIPTEYSVISKFTLAVREALRSLGFVVNEGIGKIKELFTEKVTTKELCVGDTCINEEMLKQLLEENNSPMESTASIMGSETTDITESVNNNINVEDDAIVDQENNDNEIISEEAKQEDVVQIETTTIESETTDIDKSVANVNADDNVMVDQENNDEVQVIDAVVGEETAQEEAAQIEITTLPEQEDQSSLTEEPVPAATNEAAVLVTE